MALKMAVVVDYQNVHLIAAGLYMPGCPPEEALIAPYRFATQLARARNAKNDDASTGPRRKSVRQGRL